MTIQKNIQQDIREAMKTRNSEKLSTLRMLVSALQSKQIEKRSKSGDQAIELADEEVMAVIRQEAKKRHDAIQQFTAAGRNVFAEKEKNELVILQAYLPQEIGDAELEVMIQKGIASMGGATIQEFGKIMGAVMKEVAGRASGDRVSALIKKILGN